MNTAPYLLIGIISALILLFFLPRVWAQMLYEWKISVKDKPKLREIQNAISALQSVSEEDFNIWRKYNKHLPIYKTYNEYMSIVNQTPEQKKLSDQLSEAIKEVCNTPEFRNKNHFFKD